MKFLYHAVGIELGQKDFLPNSIPTREVLNYCRIVYATFNFHSPPTTATEVAIESITRPVRTPKGPGTPWTTCYNFYGQHVIIFQNHFGLFLFGTNRYRKNSDPVVLTKFDLKSQGLVQPTQYIEYILNIFSCMLGYSVVDS